GDAQAGARAAHGDRRGAACAAAADLAALTLDEEGHGHGDGHVVVDDQQLAQTELRLQLALRKLPVQVGEADEVALHGTGDGETEHGRAEALGLEVVTQRRAQVGKLPVAVLLQVGQCLTGHPGHPQVGAAEIRDERNQFLIFHRLPQLNSEQAPSVADDRLRRMKPNMSRPSPLCWGLRSGTFTSRRASSSAGTSNSRTPASMSRRMRSPSRTLAIRPPSSASGARWMAAATSPDAPDMRPSVTSATR